MASKRTKAKQKIATIAKPGGNSRSSASRVGATKKPANRAEVAMPDKKRGLRLRKRSAQPVAKLQPVRYLIVDSCKLIWKYKKIFVGILCIYAVVQLLFVQGLVNTNFKEISGSVKDALDGGAANLMGGAALFAYLAGSNGQQVSAAGGVYQIVTTIITSLAIIWALRHVRQGLHIRVRDAFYKGMYPLIPFLLVCIVILFQMIPFLFGSWLFAVIVSNGIATVLAEKVIWFLVSLAIASATFYMITSSIIALYIVTLPDMTPMVALRSARDLVRYRRLQIFWRFCIVIILGFLSLAVLVIPVIYIAPVLAPWVFYGVSICLVVFVHAYLYGLYRELLNEK